MSLEESTGAIVPNGHDHSGLSNRATVGIVVGLCVAGVVGTASFIVGSAVQSRDVEDLQETMRSVERKLDQVVTKQELAASEQNQRDYTDSRLAELRPELASQRVILERVEKRIDESLGRVEKAIEHDRQEAKSFRDKMRDEMGTVKLRVEQQSLSK